MKYTIRIQGLVTTQQSCRFDDDREGVHHALTRALIDSEVAYSPENGGIYHHKIKKENIVAIEDIDGGYLADVLLLVDGENEKHYHLPMTLAVIKNQKGNCVYTEKCDQPPKLLIEEALPA